MRRADGGIPIEEVTSILRQSAWDYQPVLLRCMVRRMLVQRDSDSQTAGNYTGTMLPDPFDESKISIRAMIGQPNEAVQFYASRFTANQPVVTVMPLTAKQDISGELNRLAGDQELFQALLLDELGIGSGNHENQDKCAMAQAITEEAAYVVLPKDMGFGIPMREYYTDAEAALLRESGRVAPVPVERDGMTMWAEHADAWEARKKQFSKDRPFNGARLFDCQVYPRDMIRYALDSEGVKWGVVIEDINAENWCGPGSDMAVSAAQADGIPPDDWDYYGLWYDEKLKRIIGGIERGGPPNQTWTRRGTWTLIRFFTRTELIYLVSPSSTTYNGAKEIYRLRHGAKIGKTPVCPFFPVPAVRMDIDTPGKNVTGPASSVFAWSNLINQLLTLFSAAGIYNTIPRYYGVTPDGKAIRGEDGEVVVSDNAAVPGMRASELGIYAFEIKQLVIDTDTIEAVLPVFLEQLASAMPSPSMTGDAAASGTAWLAAQNIQQGQLTLNQPVDNHRKAVKNMLKVCNGWLRDIPAEITFFNRPAIGKDRREGKGIVTFDPSKLMDDFEVEQDTDTPDERVVRIQMGQTLREKGTLDDIDYFDQWEKARDPEEAVIKMWQQRFVNAAMLGNASQIDPNSLLYSMVQQLKGNVHYAMLQESMPYALGVADQMAQNANMQAQQTQQQMMAPPQGGLSESPGLGGGVSEAAGVRRPGIGMPTTLGQTLGSNAPSVIPQGL